MTEQEWVACMDPIPMLDLLGNKCGERKLRLFIAAGVKSLASIFGKDQEVLSEMHERVAEGRATEEDLERYLLRDLPELWEHRAPGGNLPAVWESARIVVRGRFKLAPLKASEVAATESRVAENAAMCSVLRCIFGNPFRPVTIDPTWLAWREGIIPRLAEAIYDNRGFTDLPILAVALEEAGRVEASILDHCRGPGPHVRGCWVVDLLLGKT